MVDTVNQKAIFIMEIIDMHRLNETQLTQAAQILTDELPIGWPALRDAMEEVGELLNDKPGAFYFAAMANEEVVGWCGILPMYGGRVYELHPLAVRRDMQRKAIGSALMEEVEKTAREAGGLTLWIAADDERPGGETSFANADLYDDLPGRMREFEPGTHQAAFYMKLGYKIVGVMPDANGRGKPDIFLAKRL